MQRNQSIYKANNIRSKQTPPPRPKIKVLLLAINSTFMILFGTTYWYHGRYWEVKSEDKIATQDFMALCLHLYEERMMQTRPDSRAVQITTFTIRPQSVHKSFLAFFTSEFVIPAQSATRHVNQQLKRVSWKLNVLRNGQKSQLLAALARCNAPLTLWTLLRYPAWNLQTCRYSVKPPHYLRWLTRPTVAVISVRTYRL